MSHPFNESLLHYLWAHRRFDTASLITTQGNRIEVLSPGEYNRDAGPDFLHARLLIDGLQWVGNVEIHLRSSDWHRHGHETDPLYANCILHVVWEDDVPVLGSDKKLLTTLELKNRADMKLVDDYHRLMNRSDIVACKDALQYIRPEVIHHWSERMAVERLETRTAMMKRHLESTRGHWEEAFYFALARGFGFNLNGDPFERLVRSVPFTLLLRLRDRPEILSALFFGMAGFLDERFSHPEMAALRSDFIFLKKKWSLDIPSSLGWKFMRTRPANFPTVRLAQFISLYHLKTPVFSGFMAAQTLEELREIFVMNANIVSPGISPSSLSMTSIGKSSINVLLINTVLPFLFLKGRSLGDLALCDKALDYLEQIEPEDHAIVRSFVSLGIKPRHAADSQGLLHLYRQYCSYKKCLNCEIGNQYLCRSALETTMG